MCFPLKGKITFSRTSGKIELGHNRPQRKTREDTVHYGTSEVEMWFTTAGKNSALEYSLSLQFYFVNNSS